MGLFDITITTYSTAMRIGSSGWCGVAPQMQDRFQPSTASRAALIAVAFWAGAFLAGCSSIGENSLTVFADPGKYQYSSCEQLARQRKSWSSREEELRLLMERAEQSAGGAVVNVLAYKGDYVAATEELKILENTARAKNCDTPENWRSNSAVR